MKLYVLFSILILISCIANKTIVFDGQEYKYYAPPNGVEIEKNFFVDQTEVSIIAYREYLYWIKRIHDINSDIYI